MIDPGLHSKTVLVTGANSPIGVGAAAARAFARQGAAVFLTYLRSTVEPVPGEAVAGQPSRACYERLQNAPVEPVLDGIHAQGGRAAAWEADLANVETIAPLFDRAEAALGPIDVLVNNAAFCESDTFLPPSVLKPGALSSGGTAIQALDPANLDRHFAVNTRAVALLMAEYVRRYCARSGTWGRIVNVSTDGADCFPGEVSYGASKHAMEGFSRSAAVELGPLGVTVNVVALGAVQTGWITPEIERRAVGQTPLRRIGQPEDVADAIVFLASEQARWITGQLLYVGGGHIMPR